MSLDWSSRADDDPGPTAPTEVNRRGTRAAALSTASEAIALSSAMLSRRPHELAAQLTGRLLSSPSPGGTGLLEGARRRREPWLRPLSASLASPGSGLTRSLTGHIDWVGAVAVSPDGRIVATGSNDGTVRIWEAASGRALAVAEGFGSRVLALAFAPEGRRWLAGCEDGTIRTLTLDSGDVTASREAHEGKANALTVTPDGRSLLSGGDDGVVRLWRLPGISDPRVVHRGSEYVLALAALPDARGVVVGCGRGPAGHARVIDLDDGTERRVFPKRDWVQAVAVSADGCHCLSGGHDGKVQVWDLRTGEQVAELGHMGWGKGWVRALAVTPDGRFAVSGGDDHIIRIWELPGGERVRALVGPARSVAALAALPDGSGLASAGGEGEVRIWDLTKDEGEPSVGGHTRDVRAVTVTPDGRRAASGGDDYDVRIWDLETGEEIATLEGHTGQVQAMDVTEDGLRLVTGSWDGTLRVWDLDPASLSGRGRSDVPRDRAQSLETLRWFMGGLAAAAGADRGDSLATLGSVGGAPLRAVRVTPDGKRVLAADATSNVRVWDLSTGENVFALVGHEEGITAIGITPDGGRAITASEDGTARVWDLTVDPPPRSDGKLWGIPPETVFAGHSASVTAVAVVPGGGRIVTGGDDGTVRVWDPDTGCEELVLGGDPGAVTALAVGSDGRRAVMGSSDGAVRVWSVAASPDTTIPELVFRGHSGRVVSVALAGGGGHAVSAGIDGTIRLWSTEGREVATFTADAAVESMAVSEEAGIVVAGDGGGAVHLLRLESCDGEET